MPRSLHLIPRTTPAGIVLLTAPLAAKVCEKCGQAITGGDVNTDSFTENREVWSNPPDDWERCV